MENAVGGKRGIVAPENGGKAKTTPEGTADAAPKIAELERMVERLIVENAGLKADREEGNARLAVLEAECRRTRNGKGESGIRRSGSDSKVLRDELARQIAENTRKDRVIEQNAATIAELRMGIERSRVEIERLRVEIRQARGHDGAPQADQSGSCAGSPPSQNSEPAGKAGDASRMKYYENANSPPSQNSEPAGKAGDASRKPASEHKKSGREKGHPGSTNKPRSTFTVRHDPEKCENCGGKNITRGTSSEPRQVTEIRPMPKAETGTHVACDGMCGDCGHKVAAPDLEDLGVMINGTSYGPRLVGTLIEWWHGGMSISAIRDTANNMFGLKTSKKTVINALDAGANRLLPECRCIAESLADARYLKADETRYPICDKCGGSTGYVWAAIGDDGADADHGRDTVVIHAAVSRGAPVLDHIAPYYSKPITCDGYVVYKSFKTRQRCMAHIIREARFLKEAHKKIPELVALHKSLQELHHEAKLLQLQSDDAPMVDTGPMVAGVLAIASEYDGYEVGKDYATYLRNAAPNMFIFVNHPGMQSTNNDTERVVRKVVLSRKVRLRIVSVKGAKTFSTLMTCLMTWKRRGLNIHEALLKNLCST